MTASAVPAWDEEASATGLHALQALLTARPDPMSNRKIATLLTRAVPAAARLLARCDQALETSCILRDDLGFFHDALATQAGLGRTRNAEVLLEELGRALACSPNTLRTLANNKPSPVHGSERNALTWVVARRLRILGATADELSTRRLTYAAVDAYQTSLAGLTG